MIVSLQKFYEQADKFENGIGEKLQMELPHAATTQNSTSLGNIPSENGKHTSPSSPAESCKTLAKSFSSGYYWVTGSNGSSIRVYCDMDRTCGSFSGGWTRITSLDMREASTQCPSGLCLFQEFPHTCRMCSKLCYHEIYEVGITYSKVCGRVIAYQIGSPDACSPDYSNSFDGIILTYGDSDAIIWVFFAALEEKYSHFKYVCTCINPRDRRIPPLVGP